MFFKSFVSCLTNVNYIGWTSIVYGSSASIFSIILGKIIKHIGMQTTMVMMLLVALINSVFMISWTPSRDAFLFLLFFDFSLQM